MSENNKNRFTDNETDCLIDSSFTDNLTKKIYVIDEWERIIGLCNNLWEQTQRFEKENQRLNTEIEQLKQEIGNLEHTKDFCADVCADCERLEKENEQLKSDNDRLVNETAKVVAKHQRKVLELIDKKINLLENDYKKAVKSGMPSNSVYGEIELLEELKKELQEND